MNEENIHKENISVFPNPSLGIVKIISEVPINGRMVITDCSGKILLTKVFDQGIKTEEINMESFPSGLYIYIWQDDGGKYFYGKIIIQ